MNELKSNIKYQPTTVSGNTHYYQPDTFTSDNILRFENDDLILRENTKDLEKIIKSLRNQLQAYKDTNKSVINQLKDYVCRNIMEKTIVDSIINQLKKVSDGNE